VPDVRRVGRLLTGVRIRRNARILHTYGALKPTPRTVQTLFFNKEADNFTYDIANEDELAGFLAESLGADVADARRYVAELQQDDDLRTRLSRPLRTRRDRSSKIAYGRRLGWYAATRIAKPALVVETGIHDGLGSAVLLRALERNAAEGVEGRLLSFDFREDVGWLLDAELKRRWDPVIGDTKKTLPAAVAGREVGLFVHDSDHAYEHERFEFETIAVVAAPGAVLISDNAHAGNAFRDFCEQRGLEFQLFRERPLRHFYPGAGIGLAVLPNS
jgi:methyltransferase family protein